MEGAPRENASPSPLSLSRYAVSPSPNELDASSDARTDADVALDIAAAVVDEQLSRQHLRPMPHTEVVKLRNQPRTVSRSQRPGRLESAVENVDSPWSQQHNAGKQSQSDKESELGVFQHLAALEEAVQSGDALAGRLPELPTNLSGTWEPAKRVGRSQPQDKTYKSIDKRTCEDSALCVAPPVVDEPPSHKNCMDELSQISDVLRLDVPIQRPGRLEDAAPDVEIPCNKNRRVLRQPTALDPSELAVFSHLAALEDAVQSGEALVGRFPELPTNLKKPASQTYPVPVPGESVALRAVGGGLLAKAPLGIATSGPRYLFGEDFYGVQPPSLQGAKKHATNQRAFARSALRGTPLSQYHHVPHASALWVNTESTRLRSEMSKSYGLSPTIAFLQNDGPKALVPLQNDGLKALCA